MGVCVDFRVAYFVSDIFNWFYLSEVSVVDGKRIKVCGQGCVNCGGLAM